MAQLWLETNSKEKRNMKMMKVLPSVILASLLMTGCTLKAGESYNTKKYKNEVTCAEFYEAFNKGAADTAKIPTAIPPQGFDASIKGSTKSVNSLSSKFNGKVRQKHTSTTNEQINAEYDADNRMGHSKVSSTMKLEYAVQYEEMVETAKQKVKGEFYGKETEKSPTEYVVNIASVGDKKVSTINNTSATFASAFVGRATSRLGFNVIPVIAPASYEAMSEEQKNQYKFFNDNGMLTVVVTTPEEGEDANVRYTSETTLVAQITFAENKFSYVIKREAKTEETYLQDYDGFLKDEVSIEKTNAYYKATIDTSAVSLEFDYSNYGKGNYSVYSMFPSLGF